MNKDELRQILSECCNDISFFYKGLASGVTVEVRDYIPTYQAWHGNDTKEYDNVDEVMNDKFYSGKLKSLDTPGMRSREKILCVQL